MTYEHVLYGGTCWHLSFEEQLRLAQLSGFDVLTTTPADYRRLRDQEGLTGKDIRRRAADHDVRVTAMDPLTTWAPEWRPDNADEIIDLLATTPEEFFAIADDLELESFTACVSAPLGTVEIDSLYEPFAKLCAQAAEHGLRVDLEFQAQWGLPDLASGWQLVETTDAPNAGIMFDIWHFGRSRSDVELLKVIPAEKIHTVQLCDGRYERQPGRTDMQDLLEDRLLLGDGEFEADRLIELLHAKGALTRLGPEYFTGSLRELSTEQLAAVIEDNYWTRMDALGITADHKRSTAPAGLT